MALPGFGRGRYNRLAPYIAALPGGSPINICTASGQLLDAITGQTEYSTDTANLEDSRHQTGCFPPLAVLETTLNTQQPTHMETRLGTTSHYFRLRTYITIGTARFSLYSLLYLDGNGQIRPIVRTFGTE
jgi:general secretion pathway protein K